MQRFRRAREPRRIAPGNPARLNSVATCWSLTVSRPSGSPNVVGCKNRGTMTYLTMVSSSVPPAPGNPMSRRSTPTASGRRAKHRQHAIHVGLPYRDHKRYRMRRLASAPGQHRFVSRSWLRCVRVPGRCHAEQLRRDAYRGRVRSRGCQPPEAWQRKGFRLRPRHRRGSSRDLTLALRHSHPFHAAGSRSR